MAKLAAASPEDDDLPEQLTQLLRTCDSGDPAINDKLFRLVYRELRRQAGHFMRGERAWHTLQPTALVNEVYLQMMTNPDAHWSDRAHFFRTAATMMRHILADDARRHNALKRGGGMAHVPVDDLLHGRGFEPERLILIDQAISRLAALDPRQASIVEMRFFADMPEQEIALVLGLSPRTIRRDWLVAKAFLAAELRG